LTKTPLIYSVSIWGGEAHQSSPVVTGLALCQLGDSPYGSKVVGTDRRVTVW